MTFPLPREVKEKKGEKQGGIFANKNEEAPTLITGR
jgi:hypothetical protein